MPKTFPPMRLAWMLIVTFLVAWNGRLTAQRRPRLDFPLKGGVAVVEADLLTSKGGVYDARGQVVITYQDLVLKAHRVVYDPATKIAELESDATGVRGVHLQRGQFERLDAQRGRVDVEAKTGTFYDVVGFTDKELIIRAASVTKTGPSTYLVHSSVLTSCDEAVPKWSLRSGRARVNINSSVRARNTIFRIKKVPIFYLPYLIYPTGQRQRQSGFLIPSTGNSNDKGRRISQSFYLTLGRSSDVTYNQDYFSERGYGYGFVFRTRPNQFSRLELDAYAVNDRLGQGGSSLNGNGETQFNGYRAVTKFNLVSSFDFRRVFSDNFFAATRPNETSQLFVTKNHRTLSINFLASREETAFVGPNAVVRTFPKFLFRVTGQRIFDSPFFFDLDASAAGLSRSDQLLETPGLTQRLDVFPRVSFSVPLGQGLRVTPRVGLRETFYSDSLDADSTGSDGRRRIGDRGLERRYAEFTLDLDGWGLSKIYRDKQGKTRFKHLIEPRLRYRYLNGIDDDFGRILRFDEVDAVADTNEVELALFNRFFVKRGDQTHEWLSIKVAQKYFFNPDFDGALRPGEVNQFFPLHTFTGFQYGAFARNSSPLTMVARLTPRPGISFDLRSDYDPDTDGIRNVSLTGFLRHRGLFLSTTYFNTRRLEIGTFQRNQLQQVFSYGRLERGLSFSGLYSYDIEASELLNWRVRLNYFRGCCGVSVQYQGFNLNNDLGRSLRDERILLFSFYLKGLGFFGNIDRPNRVF